MIEAGRSKIEDRRSEAPSSIFHLPSSTPVDRDFRAAFEAHEQQARVNTGKIAAALVAILMPFGASLDLAVYKPRWHVFLALRLGCAVLAGGIWFLLTRPFGQRHHKPLGYLTALLPAFFITWMIYDRQGPSSPYYAGLNLIILAISLVVRWNAWESLLVVVCMILMYVAACVIKGPVEALNGDWAANCIFMIETGVIVVVGNHFFNRLRFREFVLRYELDKNKKALEQTNQTLDTQNKELAGTIQKLAEAESHLVQSEKMASLGVMSAGIIHEINNPLNYATTGLYSLRQKSKYVATDQQADFDDILKDVEEGVSRVKNIVSDLRMFTHPNTDSHDQVEVTEVIEPVLRFLSAELKDNVHVEQRWPEHQTVNANKQKLIHVFTNLLQNSLDALKAKTFTDEKPTIWIEGRVEDGRSLLTIRDNGPGIESKHLGKIFDPFYTTKDVGEGMGLGLSICYRIMQECGGRISVNTESGKFCEFTLEFPAKG